MTNEYSLYWAFETADLDSQKMNDIQALYPEVRQLIHNSVPDELPQLEVQLKKFTDPMIAEAILPLASCQAVKGNPIDAIPVAAALVIFTASWRILDELEDQDRPGQLWEEIGTARAWNYACAVHNIACEVLNKAPFPSQVFKSINQAYIDTFFTIAAGQDRDLAGLTKTVEDYWLTIERKTTAFYATACTTGAMVGTENNELIQACGVFGYHLGIAIQIFNDMQSIWYPDGITDLEQGKVTLPLVYGLELEHPECQQLLSWVEAQEIATNADRIKEILDHIDTKRFLIWAALKEREQALEAIKICPKAEGREVLESYITGMFGDIDLLLQQPKVDKA
ncbi:MAG: polyprenyl synthetase family protein [Coleofasciculus sp. D1-CHI-01]|uniref:polyprenyl synthetase family protein n=1 Tax=Coleofasciculus sp. D1-CHI-01 TaxID=3068482 RepID=UPI0032F179DA